MTGGGERRRRRQRQAGGSESEKRRPWAVRRKRQLEREAERCGICKRGLKKNKGSVDEGGEDETWHLLLPSKTNLSPFHHLSLSSPSHHTLRLPLFICLLKCSNLYGLGENRNRKDRSGERGKGGSCKHGPMTMRENMIDLRRKGAFRVFRFIEFPSRAHKLKQVNSQQ